MSEYSKYRPENVRYIIRFLNTTLADCEYQITDSETRYIIASAAEIRQHQEKIALPGYVFIPDEQIGAVFSLTEHEGDVRLHTEADDNSMGKTLPWQRPCEIMGLWLAIKSQQDEAWSHEVNDFVLPTRAAISVTPKKKRFAWLPVISATAAIALLAVGVFILTATPQHEKRAQDIRQLIGNETTRYTVLQGRNNLFYVMAEDENSKVRAQRAIMRAGEWRDTVVISKPEERNRIVSEVRARWPQVNIHQLRLDNVAEPEMVLSAERAGINGTQEQTAFTQLLFGLMPYAKEIHFARLSDRVVLQQAQQEMIKTLSPFTVIKQADSATYRVKGTLQDNALNATKEAIRNFSHQYQGNYITVEIELEKERLKGKSFLYGAEGYVKMSPQHWYFTNLIEVQDEY
ncbi:PrgH/EprH family type III secretion apparatus protein [Pantoea sp. Mb-10]|uniref:PrgH/EprH family type III secretion apparatus protein n=1 Tax=unclassified Pantoea TaxID=2630326 RepID=UPI001E57FA8B|nr:MULTISPECIES: PrgH/EprH family type III secretion apparatus protein [unclassified Pantoea]MCE0489053.1 PrgH/EprH family type III secretion apparatus protein [Pantoea sp. Mb-10]MCE0503591.1 PrgH/EprH family type III secretion apparatus protein [Pantoea sp. Pb-8]